MSTLDAAQLVKRIDTVLDILVAKDYHSAINNLEILKSELLEAALRQAEHAGDVRKNPWEI